MILYIHSAFIRKNTPELRKKLQALGYTPIGSVFEDEQLGLATTINGKYVTITRRLLDSTDPRITWNCVGRIDCGTNEDLFLAIVALRNDTDKYQWFVLETNSANLDGNIIYPSGSFIQCTENYWERKDKSIFSNQDIPSHKATVEELIKHFKNDK